VQGGNFRKKEAASLKNSHDQNDECERKGEAAGLFFPKLL
jgi:hypothetical protein